MIVKELITKLGFQVDTKNLSKFDQTLSKIKKGVAAVASFYVLKTAATAVSNFVKDTVGYFDELGETAQKVGVTTQALEKFRYAAQLGGVAPEGLNSALKILSANMLAAKTGSKETAKAFAALGIKNTKNLTDVESVMFMISEYLTSMPDTAENATKKVALLREVAGRSGSDLIPMLNDVNKLRELLAKREKMGLASPEALAAADNLDEKFNEISASFDVMKRKVGVEIFPYVEQVTEEFSKWIISDDAQKSVKKFADGMQSVAEFVKVIGTVLGAVYDALSWIGEKIGDLIVFTSENKFMRGLLKYETLGMSEKFFNKVGLKGEPIVRAYTREEIEANRRRDEYQNTSREMMEAPMQALVPALGAKEATEILPLPALMTATPASAPLTPTVNKNNKIDVKQENRIEVNVTSGADASEIAAEIKDAQTGLLGDLTAGLGRTVEGSAY